MKREEKWSYDDMLKITNTNMGRSCRSLTGHRALFGTTKAKNPGFSCHQIQLIEEEEEMREERVAIETE